MGVNFTTVYPDDGSDPWEATCDDCGVEVDLDHYADMQAHDWEHADDRDRVLALVVKGGARHRALVGPPSGTLERPWRMPKHLGC